MKSIGWEQSLSTQKVMKQRERMKWKKVNHLKAKISKNNQSQWKRTATKKCSLKCQLSTYPMGTSLFQMLSLPCIKSSRQGGSILHVTLLFYFLIPTSSLLGKQWLLHNHLKSNKITKLIQEFASSTTIWKLKCYRLLVIMWECSKSDNHPCKSKGKKSQKTMPC
jgi:antibiotic biosynthesis monooxygenase (ABM) superfamily enzyme